MEKFLLACDWGTSSFRLSLYNNFEDRVAGEVLSEEGIAKMHKLWQELSLQNGTVSKPALFRQYLKKQVAKLSGQISTRLDNIPILISGMASSSIGMEDIPYATVPFALDGSDTVSKCFEAEEGFPHQIILISGVRSEKDVMRGEETQLIGVLALLEKIGSRPEEGILIFPGTHSKHIFIYHGQLLRFHTFMTGELFSVMCNYSILKDSVEYNDQSVLNHDELEAFKRGLHESKVSNILNGLFTVRTNQLFHKLGKKQNSYYLSGLLIGSEVGYLLNNEEMSLVLCSGSNLFGLYRLALDELGLTPRTTVVPFDLVDMAALKGQKLIFENHINQEVK